MITSQDIREKTFEKAKIGGYAMNEVDDFLDELADDLAVSQKENAVLRSKMKVLVEKIEEYRGSEEAMHKALVSAQKIADQIEADSRAQAETLLADAQARADELVAAAQAEADEIYGSITARREQEELRLEKAKLSASDFIQKVRMITEQERSFLDTLQDLDLSGAIVTPAPAEKKAIPAPAEEIAEAAVEELTETVEEAEEEIVETAEEIREDVEAEAEPVVHDYYQEFENAVYQEEIPEADDGEEAPLFRF